MPGRLARPFYASFHRVGGRWCVVALRKYHRDATRPPAPLPPALLVARKFENREDVRGREQPREDRLALPWVVMNKRANLRRL